MRKIIYSFISLLALTFSILPAGACATAPFLLADLPEVAQETNVHVLSKTYCKTLWSKIKTSAILGYEKVDSEFFRNKFAKTVSEMGAVLERISKKEPVMIGDELILHEDPISDEELLAYAQYYDATGHSSLVLALNSMKELGKHKGGSDLDNETIAHVNEIFVYVWNKVKEDPRSRLTAFLIGLEDAATTCIQGYSVRMLCAVHPPKQKR